MKGQNQNSIRKLYNSLTIKKNYITIHEKGEAILSFDISASYLWFALCCMYIYSRFSQVSLVM